MTTRLCAILSMALLCGSASASDLKAWGLSSLNAYGACSFAMSSAIMWGDEQHYSATRACVESRTAAVKAQLPAALTSAGATSDRVKDYFAAWTSAMQALNSIQYGSKANSESAYQSAKQRLNELWTRIEIDAGI